MARDLENFNAEEQVALLLKMANLAHWVDAVREERIKHKKTASYKARMLFGDSPFYNPICYLTYSSGD